MVGGLLGAVLLGEAVARLFPPPVLELGGDQGDPSGELWADRDWRTPPPRAFRPHPVLLFEHVPSFSVPVNAAEHEGKQFRFRTNAYGLRRDDEISLAKPAGTFRVLVLGDSQTDGYVDNDETYSQRLEADWRGRHPGRAIEVLNAGVTAYSPQQEYLWYRERGAALRPDVVVLGLYLGNDLMDLIDGQVDGAHVEDAAGLVDPVRAPLTWLRMRSRLVQLGRHAAYGGPLRDPLEAIGLRATAAPLPVDMDRLVRLMRECHGCWQQSLKQAVRARAEPGRAELGYRRLALLFRVLAERVAADGGRLAVLLIPTKTQVEPNDERGAVTRATRLLGLEVADPGYDDVVRERALAAAATAGVPVVDPLARLQAGAASGRLYYRRDWHLNPRGNEALAAALAEGLAVHGLAPRNEE